MKVIINKIAIIRDLSELEDLLTDEAINDICRPGSNDESVKAWVKKIDFELADSAIRECKDYGAHEDFKALSYNEQRAFALWCAAWNKFENERGAE